MNHEQQTAHNSNRRRQRRTRTHASIGISGAVAYIIVAMADLPSDVDAEGLTAALSTVVAWILSEATDPS